MAPGDTHGGLVTAEAAQNSTDPSQAATSSTPRRNARRTKIIAGLITAGWPRILPCAKYDRLRGQQLRAALARPDDCPRKGPSVSVTVALTLADRGVVLRGQQRPHPARRHYAHRLQRIERACYAKDRATTAARTRARTESVEPRAPAPSTIAAGSDAKNTDVFPAASTDVVRVRPGALVRLILPG